MNKEINMTKKIFISYSGTVGEKLAEVLQHLFQSIFNMPQDDIFVASRANIAGNFQIELEERIKQSDLLLMLFTPHDKILNTDWKMYEAGFFCAVTKNKGQAKVINYVFCHNQPEEIIAKPVSSYNAYRYTYNLGDGNLNDTRYLKSMVEAVAASLELQFGFEQEARLNNAWNGGGLSLKLEQLATLAIDVKAVPYNTHSAYNKSNNFIDTSVFSTKEQLIYWDALDNNNKYTPNTLDQYFECILKNFVPDTYKKEKEESDGKIAHRVIIEQTRISTFVAFTDNKNILLFDRKQADKNKTNVKNNRYDVFGSVPFENRSVRIKIPSTSFLEAPIQELKPIYGAAFEHNIDWSDSNKSEVVVMFGVFAVMSEEHLKLALENNDNKSLFIMNISSANNLNPEDLTSKAHLSIKQLIDLQHNHN